MSLLSDLLNIKKEVAKDLGKKAAYWFIGSMITVGAFANFLVKNQIAETNRKLEKMNQAIGKIEYLHSDLVAIKIEQDSIKRHLAEYNQILRNEKQRLVAEIAEIRREIDYLAASTNDQEILETIERLRRENSLLLQRLGVYIGIKKKLDTTELEIRIKKGNGH